MCMGGEKQNEFDILGKIYTIIKSKMVNSSLYHIPELHRCTVF